MSWNCVLFLLFQVICVLSNSSKNCDPNLLFDVTLVFIQDDVHPADVFSFAGPEYNTTETFQEALNFFNIYYGVDFTQRQDSWVFVPGVTTEPGKYRLYAAQVPGWNAAFPLTGYDIVEATYLAFTVAPTVLRGVFAPEGLTIPANKAILAGRYYIVERETGVRLWDHLVYRSHKVLDWPFDVFPLDFEITSPIWGSGRALGLHRTEMLPNGDARFSTRNVITFPSGLELRTEEPKSRFCDRLRQKPCHKDRVQD
eukprot:TRINITY_DN7733_c0_g1_i1.p1 TRINITY_DN7733_c0_g1~~TRINITY_DN7733_c0_g1_i1.p1  ORF type:complete len:255 (-),score=37.94 TRINITY_DN7733_c0_g1_i1:22-786(-)